MEHSIENQLQLPIVHAGVEFPRLEMPDLIKWAIEVKNNDRMAAEKRYAKNGPGGQHLSAFECQKMIQGVIEKGVELWRLLDMAREPEGIHRVLMQSLAKAGKKDAESLDILKRIHFVQQLDIALQVLSPPAPVEQPAAEKGEDGSPLSDAGSGTG